MLEQSPNKLHLTVLNADAKMQRHFGDTLNFLLYGIPCTASYHSLPYHVQNFPLYNSKWKNYRFSGPGFQHLIKDWLCSSSRLFQTPAQSMCSVVSIANELGTIMCTLNL